MEKDSTNTMKRKVIPREYSTSGTDHTCPVYRYLETKLVPKIIKAKSEAPFIDRIHSL